MLRRAHIAAFAGVLALTGCMSADAGLPRVSAPQAVALFQKTCMASAYNHRANQAAFARQAGWVAKSAPVTADKFDFASFESTTLRMRGSAGKLAKTPMCSVTFAPATTASKEAVQAALLLAKATGAKQAAGRKGGGMVSFDYKGGKAAVSVDRKTGEVALTLIKL